MRPSFCGHSETSVHIKQFDKIQIYTCNAHATDIYLSYRTLPVEKINMESSLFEIRFSLYRLQIKRYWALFAKKTFHNECTDKPWTKENVLPKNKRSKKIIKNNL